MKRCKFSNQFKRNAVEHSYIHGPSATARYFGIIESNIYRWRKQFPSNGEAKKLKSIAGPSSELDMLRKENQSLKRLVGVLGNQISGSDKGNVILVQL
jgi:transposase-like protein